MLADLLWTNLEMAVEPATRSRKEMSTAHDARIPELQVVLLGAEAEL